MPVFIAPGTTPALWYVVMPIRSATRDSVADTSDQPPISWVMLVVPAGMKNILVHISQSPAVSEMLVRFTPVPVVMVTAEPLATMLEMNSPTLPALALPTAVVPMMSGVVIAGAVAKTSAPPVPVSSVTAALRFAEDSVASAVATPAPRPDTPLEIGRPVALVNVSDEGVPPAPLNRTGAPAEPVLTASAVAMPVPSPVMSFATRTLRVFEAPAIVLFVKVSVVALPTSVSVAAGSVSVPEPVADAVNVVAPEVAPEKSIDPVVVPVRPVIRRPATVPDQRPTSTPETPNKIGSASRLTTAIPSPPVCNM